MPTGTVRPPRLVLRPYIESDATRLTVRLLEVRGRIDKMEAEMGEPMGEDSRLAQLQRQLRETELSVQRLNVALAHYEGLPERLRVVERQLIEHSGLPRQLAELQKRVERMEHDRIAQVAQDKAVAEQAKTVSAWRMPVALAVIGGGIAAGWQLVVAIAKRVAFLLAGGGAP